MPGHSNRVAPRFDPDRARALLSEAGYADGRALGEIVLLSPDPFGRTPRPTWPPSSRRSAFEFDFSAWPPFPTGWPRSNSAPPTPGSGLGRRPPRPGWRLPRADAPLGTVALPQRAARAAAGSRGLAPRPGRAPAHLSRVRTHLDRRARGRRPARVRGPPVVAAPLGHGNVGERDRAWSTFADAVVSRPQVEAGGEGWIGTGSQLR